jgi:hypothetical protein
MTGGEWTVESLVAFYCLLLFRWDPQKVTESSAPLVRHKMKIRS